MVVVAATEAARPTDADLMGATSVVAVRVVLARGVAFVTRDHIVAGRRRRDAIREVRCLFGAQLVLAEHPLVVLFVGGKRIAFEAPLDDLLAILNVLGPNASRVGRAGPSVRRHRSSIRLGCPAATVGVADVHAPRHAPDVGIVRVAAWLSVQFWSLRHPSEQRTLFWQYWPGWQVRSAQAV